MLLENNFFSHHVFGIFHFEINVQSVFWKKKKKDVADLI